jgi:hypothetical protein
VLEAFVNELLAEEAGVFLAVAEPSSTGSVSRISILLQFGHTCFPVRTDLLENLKAFFRGDHVGHVSEVDHLDKLLGLEATDESPEGIRRGSSSGGPTCPRTRS